jgi:hypothetical protein
MDVKWDKRQSNSQPCWPHYDTVSPSEREITKKKILLKVGNYHRKIIIRYCMLKKCFSVHGTVRCFEDCPDANLTTFLELQTFIQNRMI